MWLWCFKQYQKETGDQTKTILLSTASPSFPDIYHTSLSKLLDTKISIAGAFVLKNSLFASYLPVVKKIVKS